MPTMIRTSLVSIPEDASVSSEHCADDPINIIGPIIWTAVLRDNMLLLDIGEEDVPEPVLQLAQTLLDDDAVSNRHQACYHGTSRTLVDDDNNSIIWKFCLVYNTMSEKQAERFLEHQIAWTRPFRNRDPTWRNGGHHCLQVLFGPLLQQRILDYRIVQDDDEEEEEWEASNADVWTRSLGAHKPRYCYEQEDEDEEEDNCPFEPKLDERDSSPSQERPQEYDIHGEPRAEQGTIIERRMEQRPGDDKSSNAISDSLPRSAEPETDRPEQTVDDIFIHEEASSSAAAENGKLEPRFDFDIDDLEADDLPLVSTPPSPEPCFCWRTPLKTQINALQTTGLD